MQPAANAIVELELTLRERRRGVLKADSHARLLRVRLCSTSIRFDVDLIDVWELLFRSVCVFDWCVVVGRGLQHDSALRRFASPSRRYPSNTRKRAEVSDRRYNKRRLSKQQIEPSTICLRANWPDARSTELVFAKNRSFFVVCRSHGNYLSISRNRQCVACFVATAVAVKTDKSAHLIHLLRPELLQVTTTTTNQQQQQHHHQQQQQQQQQTYACEIRTQTIRFAR
jgi:hypothetical protein